MAATVAINRYTGVAPGTLTRIDAGGAGTTRASTSDAPTPGTADPIPIPAAGTNYSYWVSTRLEAITSPTGTINNLNWYTDGANGFGTGVTASGAKASTGADAGYRQATGTQGTSGTQLTQVNHTGLDAAPADIFTYTSGAPLALVGSITNPSTGAFGDFVVWQIAVTTTATAGTTPAETFTFQYDET